MSADDTSTQAFSGRLGFGQRPAIIVVDVTLAYLDPASPLYAPVEPAVASAGRVVHAAREAGVPVVFTRVEYTPGLVDAGVFGRKIPGLRVFEKGSPLARFPDQLAPAPGELVITKQYASAFFGTSLASILAAGSVDTVVIVGLSTSGCVRATATDACQHGYLPVVVREAVGDRHPAPHEANLFDLDAKYADVRSEGDVINLLGAHARHAAEPTPRDSSRQA